MCYIIIDSNDDYDLRMFERNYRSSCFALYNLTYVPFTQLQLLAHNTTKSCTTCSVWILPLEYPC